MHLLVFLTRFVRRCKTLVIVTSTMRSRHPSLTFRMFAKHSELDCLKSGNSCVSRPTSGLLSEVEWTEPGRLRACIWVSLKWFGPLGHCSPRICQMWSLPVSGWSLLYIDGICNWLCGIQHLHHNCNNLHPKTFGLWIGLWTLSILFSQLIR